MNEHESILYFQSLERMVASRESAVNDAKDQLKKAKDAFDTAVNELRLAIRRDDEQQELPFTDAQVLGEDRQLPENKSSDVPDGVLFENPIDGLPATSNTDESAQEALEPANSLALPDNVLTLPPRPEEEEEHPGEDE